MSTMLHKVAAAIAAADLSDAPDDPTFDFYALTEEVADIYYDIARAAIEAMMEPRDEMIQAGVSEDQTDEVYRDVRSVYTAMIRAALKEQA
ncbi:hypothetical protein CN085_19685 [Sinorhizobium meliloti]|uniref:hypothetical protein n=1 Tax=Rhizobium meliloti TaxID=382 RepID=UPI000FD9F2D5|nr:hypothetical protein [Sinorhizobium meliloti]RVP13136.1 hypothetical protein CN085_19685 [Sinorhizobium meliloti]